jgi:F0F1-type ATP synthase epsilon subunit
MPLTLTLKEAGLTLLVDDEYSIERMAGLMRKDRTVVLATVTGKKCVVRTRDITFVREITPDEVEENKKQVQAQLEKERRFTPAPKLSVPHGFKN